MSDHGYVVDEARLPSGFPTHLHSSEFWEELGRTVATFGFLEEMLGKAIFALTGTRDYRPDDVQAAFEKWILVLERALSDPLGGLIDNFAKALNDHQRSKIDNFDELLEDLKEATRFRNAICHGSWRAPDADGKSQPLFVSKRNEVFGTPVDRAFLIRLRQDVVRLICAVINSVTHMGYQFPGSSGPGSRIWTNSSAVPLRSPS